MAITTAASHRGDELEIGLPQDYVLNDLLWAVFEWGASDLHLCTGAPPILRIHGLLHPANADPLSHERIDGLLRPLINEEQMERVLASGNLDFGHELPGVARFRCNYFVEHYGLAGVFRVIPDAVPKLDDLNMPDVFKEIANYRSGLVVVTGPTGSGKSTTLAAIIDYINTTRSVHIITIEDPLEFIHPSRTCRIVHREVGAHAVSFSDALRASLREDPDIVMVGEMRDLETIYQAIKAAETGVLVFATLHTKNAAKTVDRIIDVFPARQQQQIRSMLSESLKAVIAQQLIRRKDGNGRVAALEILLSTPGVGNLIRDRKTSQIRTMIETGRNEGMQTMDNALAELVRRGVITRESALEKASDPILLEGQLE